tara:strand:- start:271 stop:981 length:711 start_codon:yes stop_codon:yes gene_type:complete
MDAEDVVVSGEHVHGDRVVGGSRGDNLDLRVVDPGEVAGAGRLVLLGLERERVRVDTGVGGAGVVVVGLDLVEVLALLLLETVLTVEDELEGGEGTDDLLSEEGGGGETTHNHRGTSGGGGNETVRAVVVMREELLVGFEPDVEIGRRGGEVPQGVVCLGVGEAPYELLNGVVVGEADLLGTTISGNSVSAGVLHLLNEVFVTLLGESATLLGVKVDVVGPHLEHSRVEVGGEVRR